MQAVPKLDRELTPPISLPSTHNQMVVAETKEDMELSNVLLNAKQLLHRLSSEQVKSPAENLQGLHGSMLSPPDRPLSEKATVDQISSAAQVIDIPDQMGVLPVLKSLVYSLEFASRQLQQYKFKNMMLTSANNDNELRVNVERNLKKQELERMKNQLLMTKQNLNERLNSKDIKIRKYKKRIIEKNKEINKLARMLNISAAEINHNNGSSFEYSNSTISSLRTTTTAETSDTHGDTSANRFQRSNMLRTLGALASQVLNDETEDTSINRTILQSGSKLEDDTTDAETSFIKTATTNNSSVIPNNNNSNNNNDNNTNTPVTQNTPLPRFNTIPILPEIKKLPIGTSSTKLPRLRSFNTVDGSVKD